MIELPIPLRDDFKDKVKNFCSKNNIIWGTVYSESWVEGVHGTPEECVKVQKYVDKLKQDGIRK